MNKRWEDWEKKIVREVYPEGGVEACMELLPHRTGPAIQKQASMQGTCLTPEKFLEVCKSNASKRRRPGTRKPVSLDCSNLANQFLYRRPA